MTQSPGDEVREAVARHASRREDVKRVWIYGGVVLVAAVAIAVLSTLLWVNSQDNADRLAQSSDAQRQQFITCQDLPKTDSRCQQPVAPPAKEIVKGPQGIQGVQGIQGDPGPKGEPGTPCVPSNPACRGPRGPAGPTPACMLLPSKCQGPTGLPGKDGINGKDGKDGIDGKNGVDGKDGVDGANGKDGKDGADGAKGDSGYDLLLKDCTDAEGSIITIKVSGDDPATVEVEPMVTVRTCVIP